jgi:hypothetical protein
MALPQLGVEALFLIEKFQRNAKKYDQILGQAEKSGKKLADSTAKSTEQMARSYDELIKKSSELQRAMSEMSSKRQANLIEGLQGAFGKLGDTAGIDVSIFDKLVGSGESIGAAFQGATTSAAGFGGAAITLGAALAGVGVAVGLVVAGISAGISVIKESISAYQQSAEELRKMQMQLGGSTEEVSKLLQAAQLTGTQINHLAAGIGMFEKKMVDFELRMAVGSEESHEFERALKVLGVEIKDADGTLRPLNDVLMDSADRFKELGPGVTTTGLAMNLFGRSGRQVLPFLMEGADGLQRFMEIAEKTGSVLTTKDTKAAYELQQAMTELDMSVQGVKNTLAREFVPAAEWVVSALSEIVQGMRGVINHFISGAASGAAYIETLIKTGSAIKAAAAMTEAYTAKALQLSGALTEQEKAEEAALIAAQARAQEVARAEMAQAELLEKVDKLNEQRKEKVLEAELTFGRQWEDIITQRGRQIEDAEISEARRREDLWRQYQRRLEDIEEDFNKRREDQRRDNQKKLDDFWDRMNLRREKLLNRHLERMQAIRERFAFSASEAARRNDAVALLRAMRQRDLDVKLEKTRYKNRKAELEKDIALRLKKLKDSFEEQRKAEERRLEDAIEQAKKAYARQLEDLAIALERQEADRQRSWQRQEEDYNTSMRRRDEDRLRWYEKERAELDEQLAAINAILGAGYKTQEEMQKEHLDRTLNQRRAWREAEAAMSLPTPTPTPAPMPRSYIPRGAAPHFRAEGGLDVVSRPTTFVAGEAGPEVHAWAPVGSNVHHTFDRMGMDIGGVSPATEAQLAPLMVEMLSKMVRQIR